MYLQTNLRKKGNTFRRHAAGLMFGVVAMQAGLAHAQEALTLPVPAQPAGPICAPVQETGGAPVTLKRTFFEDFNSLDLSSKWTPHYDSGYDWNTKTWQGYDWVVKRTQPGVREQQIYVDPNYRGKSSKALNLNPFKVQNSILTITADRIAPEFREALAGFEFTSGLLTTRKSFTQKWGYFETRAKVPAGPNLVPAFWMLADDRTYPQELDVMEAPGHAPDKDKIVQTIHWEDANKQKKASGCRTLLPSFEKDFHYYGALWTPERIVYYLDRKPVGQIQTPSSFTYPMYMMINLAIGGAWVGDAGPDRPMPVTFDVDNISAYTMGSAIACTKASNGVLQCQGQ